MKHGDEQPTGDYLHVEVAGPDMGSERAHGEGHGPHGDHDSGHGVRELEHRGHTVRIRTTYEIEIDGEPWAGQVHAAHDGSVHYMGMPQYATGSTVDLVKRVIDLGHEGQVKRRAARKEQC